MAYRRPTDLPSIYLRQGRRAAPLPQPPPFPAAIQAQLTPPELLPSFIQSLALSSSYQLATPATRALLKRAWYAFALNAPFATLFFGDQAASTLAFPAEVTDSWSLSKAQLEALSAQGGAAGVTSGEYSESRRGKVCGHVFQAGESVYRCRDCALDGTCVVCSKCYHGSSHARDGHDVTLSIHSGAGAGCCDCGDIEAFKEGSPNDCKYHSPHVAPRSGGGGGGGNEDLCLAQDLEAVEQLKKTVGETLRVLVDWTITVLEDSPDDLGPPKTVDDLMAQCASRPPPPSFWSTPPPVVPSADPSSSFVLSSPPSYVSSTSRGKARADNPEASSSSTISSDGATPAGPWSVVLWNDEKHSFTDVIDQVSLATGVSHREASAVAQRVDTYGRDVVFISSDPTQLLLVSRIIAEIELRVTVRPALDTFYEQVAGELVGFLKDLCSVTVRGEGGVLAEVLAEVLLERTVSGGKSRFQKLMLVDSKLWKQARRGLAEVYVTLLGVGPEVKRHMSVHFAEVYSKIVDAYLLVDRETENSIISLGVQVFTVPSIAAYLFQHHEFVSVVIMLLFSFFTEQIDPENPRHLIYPANPVRKRINPESPAFKQKRYFQLFSDLLHLIQSTNVKRLICASPNVIESLAAFLDLFSNMNPNKRAVGTHVEYESETWVQAFNVTIQLGKVCRSYGEAFRLASPYELAVGLSKLIPRLKAWSITPAYHVVQLGNGATCQLVDFKVDEQYVSFHHPLVWLFAEMCKNVEALDDAQWKKMGFEGFGSLSQFVLSLMGQQAFLGAMDQPLRVIVLVSQIRAGLWVRNGFGVRAQQLHYKEYSLRENTYDQDVFFLQIGLIVLDPSLVFLAIVDRFQLREWLVGTGAHPVYDVGQAFTMLEEMVYLLITLLSDGTNPSAMEANACLRRELVHHLALGPSPYSDLIRRVSERFSDEPALDKILDEVATFKHPTGTSDQGTYTLRPECFAEVNPYFPRFTRNQREEADKIVREHLKKTTGEKDPAIVPRPLNITAGPFVALSKAFNSGELHEIIFFSLKNGLSRGDMFSEVLVDEALHLAMLTLVEQPAAFVQCASVQVMSVNPDERTLVHLLAKVEVDDRVKAVRNKARWCLDRLVELIGPEVQALRTVEDSAPAAKALDAKRLAAKARQEAIMAQFAQAQKSFLESSENIDDEDEDEMEGDEPKVSLGSCIVCQDELDDKASFGLLAFVQSSNFLRVTPKGKNSEFQQEVLDTPSSLDRDASAIRPFGIAAKKIPVNLDDESGDGLSQGFPQCNQSGLHASACGHMMHLACFNTYQESVRQRHHLQPTRCQPEDIDRHEFTCPLCKSLGNVLLPASVEPFEHPLPDPSSPPINLDEWSYMASDSSRLALSLDIPQEVVGQFVHAARKLHRSPAGKNGLAAWEINSSPSARKMSLHSGSGAVGIMITRLLQVADPLMQELGIGFSFLPSELVAYTVSCIEVASRGTTEPAASLPEATTRMLQSLLSSLRTLAENRTFPSGGEAMATIAVMPHIGGIFTPEHERRNKDLFRYSPLGTIIEAAAICPESFHQVVAFCFYTELVRTFFAVHQLLASSDSVVSCSTPSSDEAVDDYLALANINSFFVASEAAGLHSEQAAPTVGKLLYSYMLTFVRRVAVVQGVLFGYTGTAQLDDSTSSELSRLLAALRIPHPRQALDPQCATPGTASIQAHISACGELIPGWLACTGRAASSPEGTVPKLPTQLPSAVLQSASELQHPAIYELVGLPHQLATVAAECLQRECERCNQVPAEPALCLLCGQIVCQQSFCCMDAEEEAQHGECNTHMWTCGGSVGVYFLVKRNSVLYLYTEKGTFASPPYLDSHGEVDLGGRRGRNQFPQYLHAGRFDEIRKAWMNHGIPTFVARKLDATTDHGGWSTF